MFEYELGDTYNSISLKCQRHDHYTMYMCTVAFLCAYFIVYMEFV